MGPSALSRVISTGNAQGTVRDAAQLGFTVDAKTGIMIVLVLQSPQHQLDL